MVIFTGRTVEDAIEKGLKDFPHKENNFLMEFKEYPHICIFSKEFLEYSSNDTFFTALCATDILCKDCLVNVIENSMNKLKL